MHRLPGNARLHRSGAAGRRRRRRVPRDAAGSESICLERSPAPAVITGTAITPSRADVLVVMKDVVGIVRGLHVHQPVIDTAVRLADPIGVFVVVEKVDVDAFAEAAQGGEESPRPSSIPLAEVLA